jgi:hypothetical protein
VLGAMMTAKNSAKSDGPSILHAVALLTDRPEQRLARGQVGTIVEELDEATLLVEFSDDEGQAYAIVPCPRADCWSCITSLRRPNRRTTVVARKASRKAAAPLQRSPLACIRSGSFGQFRSDCVTLSGVMRGLDPRIHPFS